MIDSHKDFVKSIPEVYDKYLVPQFFEPYSQDLVKRLKSRHVSKVLEIAAGTGVVTRKMSAELPNNVSIIATDLNQAMIDRATAVGTSRSVEWKQADAMALPFPDKTFDAVVCQFGAMFFPDKPKAFTEVRRVLRPGGIFIFNVWDKLGENEFSDTANNALKSAFPTNPPRFLETPYGYHDKNVIERDLTAAGFKKQPQISTVSSVSKAQYPHHAAKAISEGTPLRNELEARGLLDDATDAITGAISERFGTYALEGKTQAHVISVEC